LKIAYVVYPDFTALDLVGPYEVISRWPEADVYFLASALDPVRCDAGLTVIPTDTPPFDSGEPTKADASTLRMAFRLLLGDRPLQMAARVNGQAVAARLVRARRALTRRRTTESARN
jgi:hypothetical protein